MGVLYAISIKTDRLLSSLVEIFPQYSRERLFSFILCGNIKVHEETIKDHTRIIKKTSTIMLLDESLESDENESDTIYAYNKKKYVSRGGEKLAPIIDAFIDTIHTTAPINDTVWLDCGCATGGFTQCLLERNVRLVHAVDVAYNSLDYTLRIDSRVIVHERTNVLSLSSLDPIPQYAVADLSFRSLRGIAGPMVYLCEERCVLALCKPQFEYADALKKNHSVNGADNTIDNNKEQEDFNGVITDLHIVQNIMQTLCIDLIDEGVGVVGMYPAGIRGKQGNQEYFLVLVDISYDKSSGEIHYNPRQMRPSIQKNAMIDSYHNMISGVLK